ncbi:MAG: aldo/keto reductase, partial [Hylemonella sp.]
VALAWLLAQGGDVIPIPGTKRRKYLEENLAAAGLPLSEEELAQLSAQHRMRTARVLQRQEGRATLGGLGGVALEAVNLDRSEAVATDAEIGGRSRHALSGLAGMALDAGFQAVLGAANAATQGVVALVLEVFHVVAPHRIGWLNALGTTGRLDDRFGNARGFAWLFVGIHGATKQQQA